MAESEHNIDSPIGPADQPPANPTEGGAPQEVINLEDLVRGIDAAPSGAAGAVTSMAAPAQAEAVAPAAEPPGGEKPAEATPVASTDDNVAKLKAESSLDPDKLDSILLEEDPDMAAQAAEIREAGAAAVSEMPPDLESDDAVVDQALRTGRHTIGENLRFQILKLGTIARRLKVFARRLVKDSKGVAHDVAVEAKVRLKKTLVNRKEQLGRGAKWFGHLSIGKKLAFFAALATAAMIPVVMKLTLSGKLLPQTEKEWVASFTERADGVFTYELTDETEDFNDPLLHPEFVVLIERIIANLQRTVKDGASMPMAAFELYLQTDNQESAIEIKDRNVEIRDIVARAVERSTYPELVTEEGKAKLKLVIRKDLNELLIKGHIRRVFFKTIILNPEEQ